MSDADGDTGKSKWSLVDKGIVSSHPAPQDVDLETTVGAGDAACAGLVNALVRESSIVDEVDKAATKALQTSHATSFSKKTSSEALQKFMRKNRNRKYILLFVLGLFTIEVIRGVIGWFVEYVMEWLIG